MSPKDEPTTNEAALSYGSNERAAMPSGKGDGESCMNRAPAPMAESKAGRAGGRAGGWVGGCPYEPLPRFALLCLGGASNLSPICEPF